jgi:hypothetical protein
MSFGYRFAIYVLGGGTLLAWADPSDGLVRYALILLYIVAAAYVDALIAGKGRLAPAGRAADLATARARKRRRTRGAPGRAPRHPPRPMYSTTRQQEAEGLLALLRAKGLNPFMVTQKRAGADSPALYEVLLPESELGPGKHLTDQFTRGSRRDN